jgi:hypothetical protein
MISIEPALLSPTWSDEDIEFRVADALEALALRVEYRNVRAYMVEQEPSLLLGLDGNLRLDEIRDAAVEHANNLCAVAGDGETWLDVDAQRFVSNFFVKC